MLLLSTIFSVWLLTLCVAINEICYVVKESIDFFVTVFELPLLLFFLYFCILTCASAPQLV